MIGQLNNEQVCFISFTATARIKLSPINEPMTNYIHDDHLMINHKLFEKTEKSIMLQFSWIRYLFISLRRVSTFAWITKIIAKRLTS